MSDGGDDGGDFFGSDDAGVGSGEDFGDGVEEAYEVIADFVADHEPSSHPPAASAVDDDAGYDDTILELYTGFRSPRGTSSASIPSGTPFRAPVSQSSSPLRGDASKKELLGSIDDLFAPDKIQSTTRAPALLRTIGDSQRRDSQYAITNEDTGKKVLPEDLPLSALPPFSRSASFKYRDENPMVAAIFHLVQLESAVQDRKLKALIHEYTYKQGLLPKGELLPPAVLGMFADRSCAILQSSEDLSAAYKVAQGMSTFSQGAGMISIGGVAKETMSSLHDEAKAVSASLTPADKFQLLDFAVKGVLGVYYQHLRLRAENPHPSGFVGSLYSSPVAHMQKTIREMWALYQTNPYNRSLWHGYLLLDGAINVLGHFIASGRPVGEASDAFKGVLHRVQDLSIPMVSDVAKTIIPVSGAPMEAIHHKYHPNSLLVMLGGMINYAGGGIDLLRLQERTSRPDIVWSAITLAHRDLQRDGVL